MMRVAFVGLGRMGGAMAGHVARSEHSLSVYDTRPDAVDALGALGARAATSPADGARDAEVVSVVVLNDAQVLDVVAGPDGVLQTMARDTILAVHSTVTLDCLRRVVAAAAAHGVRVLDVGISGGIPGAEAGTLFVLAGGDAAVLERARPALEPWAGEIAHLGPVGAGMTAKAARNYVQYAAFAALHEGRVLAAAGGVDLAQFAHVIRRTRALDAAQGLLDRPDAAVRATTDLGEHAEFLVAMIELGWKDLEVAGAIAQDLGVELPSLAGTRTSYGPSLGVDLTPS